MYAAAGGASLASRQARQRQRQQKKQQLQAKLHPPKVAAVAVAEHGASTPTRQSRQFHQLPTNYLRTPQAQARKLSSSYTTQSRLLLPIDEGDTQSVLNLRMHSHAHGQHAHSHSHQHQHQLQHHHHHQQQQQHHHTGYGKHVQQNFQQYGHSHSHGRISSKLVHRHSGSSGTGGYHQHQHLAHLTKSATATLPLVSQFVTDGEAEAEATTPIMAPSVPSGAAVAIKTTTTAAAIATATAAGTPPTTIDIVDNEAIALAQPHDAIIVTPATPMASPGHVAKLRDQDLSQAAASERQPLTSAEPIDDDDVDEPMQPPTGPLERKCSVYRMRRSDAFEHDVVAAAGAGSGVKRQLRELQFNYQQQQQYEPLLTDEPQLLFKGIPGGRKLQVCAYCEEGICLCEHIECAQGRAAWLERGRRCSVQEAQQQAACHRRWVKRNRIQDASLGGSSDDEDFLGVLRGPSTFANAFLYVGLGTVALGLVIAFVGTGEKGFKTVELRLIGPSLIGLGLICCILRILFCICPSHCIASNKTRKKNGNKVDADHTTSLLRGENKRVSIARSSSMQPKYPATHKRSQSKMLNEGMEALRQIATTSLFMQNEQKPSMNRVVPIIKEPESQNEGALEMKKLHPPIQVREVGYRDECKGNTTRSMADKAQITKSSKATQVFEPMDSTTTATAMGKRQTITSPTTTNPSSTSTPTTNNSSSASNQTIFKATPAIRQTERTIPPPQGTVTNSVGKLTRQRVVFNQDEHPQKQISFEQSQSQSQSQSISSSSTVKKSIDGDLLMETSLMALPPPPTPQTVKAAKEDHIAILTPNTSDIPVTTTPQFGITSAAVAAAAAAATKTVFSTTPLYTAANAFGGAVSTTAYDLPPAMPHTYSYSRLGAADRETLIRGPLGMTASPSTYTLPASAAATPVTTPSAAAVGGLLPTPSPPSQAPSQASTFGTFEQQNQHTEIPGQVFDAGPSTSAYARLGAGSIHSTPGLITSMPMTSSMTQLQKTSMPMSYKFPAPLSSSASPSSSASSNGRAPPTIGISSLASLAPPSTPPANKFEPELLLSPAKLGQ